MENIEIVKTRFDQYQNKGLQISPNDYFIQLINYIYYIDTDQNNRKRRISILAKIIRTNIFTIVMNKTLSRK